MEKRDVWQLEMGARPRDGGVVFRVWAPRSAQLSLQIVGQNPIPMERRGGFFELLCPGTSAGADYQYCLDSGNCRPDPVSRWQPQGVHGPSRVVDPEAYSWNDTSWRGVELRDLVFYELHVGTFSPQGTFDGVIEKLSHLRDLGITALSIMPVAQFPGGRNWGYDGAYPYAVQESYGGPEGFKRLVDACHRQGLAVVLDVVYNHLGPEGTYLAEYGHYFTDHYRTSWGRAVNYDGQYSDFVRRYVVDNALYWLTEYHVDGLRLDAVHAIYDYGAYHILAELKEAFAAQAEALGRKAWIIAESDLNDVRILNPKELGGYGIDSQWHDDFHHAVTTALTQRKESYFVDFGSLDDVRKAVEEGFVIDGRYSEYRKKRHGSSTRKRPGTQFVCFIQNHDQIANACEGRRLATLLSVEGQKLAAMLYLCGPALPMLFMGEEWGAETCFYYFTSFEDPALAQAVREGRMKESFGEAIDPQAEETFRKSCLDWGEEAEPAHQTVLAYYRDLLRLRKSTPALSDCRKDLTKVVYDEAQRWLLLKRSEQAIVVSNFSDRSQEISLVLPLGEWCPVCSSFDRKYGGKHEPVIESLIGDDVPVSLELPSLGATLLLRKTQVA